MPLVLTWQDIALRLALTLFAGSVIGINRDEHGHPAGLRTAVLVCLAASIAMIQVNLLLPAVGRHSDSFNMLDLMRLPLGILSGMGFIGGGAILRKDSMVRGLTTAATLWFVTVLGLCFGGGQIQLGIAGLAIGWIVLSPFKKLERFILRDHRGNLLLVERPEGPNEEEIRGKLSAGGFVIMKWGMSWHQSENWREINCDLSWRARSSAAQTPSFVKELAEHPGVIKIQWSPQG